MAVVISPVSEHNVIILSDFGLTVAISGNPSDVAVKDIAEDGFYYDWRADDGELDIKGTAEKLLSEKQGTIIADTETLTFIYNVVPATPVITPIERQTIYKGSMNEIFVPISGSLGYHTLDILWIGLQSEILEGEEEDDFSGVRIFGDVPYDAEFTRTSGTATLYINNNTEHGEDTTDIEFDIVNDDSFYINIGGNLDPAGTIYKVNPSGILAWEKTDLPTDNYDNLVACSTGGVFAFRNNPYNIYKVDTEGTLEWTFTGLSSSHDNLIAASDGGVFAFRDDTDDIQKIGANGTSAWTYTGLPTASYEPLIAASDGGVFAFRVDTDDVYKISASGTLTETYTALPAASQNYFYIASDDSIFGYDRSGDNLYKVNTDDTLAWTYPVSNIIHPHSGSHSILPSNDGGIFLLLGNVEGTNEGIRKIGSDGTEDWTYDQLSNGDRSYSLIGVTPDNGIIVYLNVNTDLAGPPIYKIAPDGTLAWSYLDLTPGNISWDFPVLSSGGNIYIFEETNRIVYKINGDDGTLDWSYDEDFANTTPYNAPVASL